MANQATNIFEAIGQNLYNSAYSGLTGKPIPGSTEAVQAEIQKQTLEKQLADLKKDPSDPKALERVLQGMRGVQALTLKGKQADQALNMQFLGADTLLDARTRTTEEDTSQSIRKEQAGTQNEINLFDAKTGRQREILGDITGQELKLAEHDTKSLEQVLKFYAAAHDKNLRAQADARKPNIGALLAGLGATAATLFS
jgi:hypothetical protein